MAGPVFLRGDAVTLHPLEPDDAPFLAALVNRPEVRRSLAADRPLSEADERAWIESLDEHNPDGLDLLIRADDDPVGTVGISDVVQRWGTGEVGFMVDPDHWNNGYATDAVATVADYAFGELRFEKLLGRVYEDNPASASVLDKAGFVHEGTLRNHAHVDGERVDPELYGLLAAD